MCRDEKNAMHSTASQTLLITTYQEVMVAPDQVHVAMTKMSGLVATLVCQSNTFSIKIKKDVKLTVECISSGAVLLTFL
jgi:acetylglutamate synthase